MDPKTKTKKSIAEATRIVKLSFLKAMREKTPIYLGIDEDAQCFFDRNWAALSNPVSFELCAYRHSYSKIWGLGALAKTNSGHFKIYSLASYRRLFGRGSAQPRGISSVAAEDAMARQSLDELGELVEADGSYVVVSLEKTLGSGHLDLWKAASVSAETLLRGLTTPSHGNQSCIELVPISGKFYVGWLPTCESLEKLELEAAVGGWEEKEKRA